MSNSKNKTITGVYQDNSAWVSRYEKVKKELADDEFATNRFNTAVKNLSMFREYWNEQGGDHDKFIESLKYTVSLSTASAEVEMLRTLNEQRAKDGRKLINIPTMKDIRHMTTHQLIDTLGIGDEILDNWKAIRDSLVAKGYSLNAANRQASEWIAQNWFGSE